MKTQKTIAAIMILASSLLTGWATRDISFPAALCMLGLLGLQRRLTWDIRPEKRVIKLLLLFLLAALFALHYRYTGAAGRLAQEQAAIVAWQTITRYFLASMILLLFLGTPKRLPFSMAPFHIASVAAAGQVLLLDDLYIPFRLSELLSVTLVVLYAATAPRSTAPLAPVVAGPLSSQRPACPRAGRGTSRGLVVGLALLLAVNSGWIIGSVLYRHTEVLNVLPAWFWRGNASLDSSADLVAHVGFNGSGKLSSIGLIKGDQDPTPVLSIVSDRRPGYLRARAFEVYADSSWHEWSQKEEILSTKNTPFGVHLMGRMNGFRLADRDASECQYMTIRHEAQIADAVFAPPATAFLEAPFDLVLRDENDIVYPPRRRSSASYRLGYAESAPRNAPHDVHLRRLLKLPGELDRRIEALAERIFADCRTTAEKIDAVVSHFHADYTYALGLTVPPGRDNLTYFLLEASTGYCEYFASGAAVLLRLADVPTRYVTGFLVTEQDTEGDDWVARNMDAHAWVEAWDQDRRQWVIVEATVQELASTSSADESDGMASGGRYLMLRQLLQALYEYGLFGVFSWLFDSYRLFASSLFLAIVLGGALWWVLSRLARRRSRRLAQAVRRADPEFAALHRILARMDRKVKAAGHRRDLSETLYAFAQRLRTRDCGDGRWTSIARWYRDYANLRYCRAVSADSVQRLQQHARRLQDAM